MKADLKYLVGEIDRETSVETRKLCVAVGLSQVRGGVDSAGMVASSNQRTMIAAVKNNMDKEVLVNAYGRSTFKYTLFLANLSSAIVDGWDLQSKYHGAFIDNDLERQKARAKLEAWISDYEIPHKILMDYLGDVFECKGEWVRSEI